MTCCSDSINKKSYMKKIYFGDLSILSRKINFYERIFNDDYNKLNKSFLKAFNID